MMNARNGTAVVCHNTWPTSAQRDECRLDAADEAAIIERVNAIVLVWIDEHGDEFLATVDALRLLLRHGARAIGCTLHDLRDSELDLIEQHARTALGW